MGFDSIIALEIVGAVIGAVIIVLIFNWAANRNTKIFIKDLKPDIIEKERALELIEKQNDKVQYFEELMQKYAKINFEKEIRRSPIFATVLFEEIDKYLLIQNQPIEAKNLEVIKIIIKDESKELLFYDIVKNFFICLILDIDFDYKDYRDPIFELYGLEEKKDMNNKNKNLGIVFLKGTVEAEYIYIK
ncbi:hypothetical protein COBT_001644, partial [Conglomerata obtusa]